MTTRGRFAAARGLASPLDGAGRRALTWARGRGRHEVGGFFFDDVRPDDTYLVSFPRSGNTYLRYLVAALVLDRAPTAAEVQEVVPDVHRSPTSARPPRQGPLVAKSHAPVSDVAAKVVYLVRDGRAALLSYHRYLQRRGRPTPAGPDDMLAWRAVWPCPWAEHVSGWVRHLDGRDDALVVRYEDLVAEPARVLRDVAGLAGLACTDENIARAVRQSSVGSMQRAEQGGAPGSLNFVAAAEAGSWRDVFGSEALRRFEASHSHVLRGFGYAVGDGRAGDG